MSTTPEEAKKELNTGSRFVKGKSGNPKGRPKGAKHKVTILKEAVLAESENMVLKNWTNVVQKTIDLANEGDSTALKILWDRFLPAKQEVKGNGNKMSVSITIEGMEVKSVGQEPVDAEFEEIKDV